MNKNYKTEIKSRGIQYAELAFSDIYGADKSLIMPIEKFQKSGNVYFDGSSVKSFAPIKDSDMKLHIEYGRKRVIPWRTDTILYFCSVRHPDGTPAKAEPRFILEKQLAGIKQSGIAYKVGAEIEFYLFEGTKPVDESGYFSNLENTPRALSTIKLAIFYLNKLGIEVGIAHHEVGPGQFEIGFKYSDAVLCAENVFLFKRAVREAARRNNLTPCFMPKPLKGKAGNGMHINQSLYAGNKNLFYPEKLEDKLSEDARHFIAGQLKHAEGLCAIVAPSINSYKRLAPGYEAPTNICWGERNRSALIRVPYACDKSGTRIEFRCSDSSANPYLAFAALLAAGIDGISKKMPEPKPILENAYSGKIKLKQLPPNLGLAISALKKDKTLLAMFGDRMVADIYINSLTSQWEEHNTIITDFELGR